MSGPLDFGAGGVSVLARFFNDHLVLLSVRSDSPGKSVWAGGDPAGLLHHPHHEWPGSGRRLRCVLHDLRSGQ